MTIEIVLIRTTTDGVRERKAYKSLAAARRYVVKWVGLSADFNGYTAVDPYFGTTRITSNVPFEDILAAG
jgi:hypothetical protein